METNQLIVFMLVMSVLVNIVLILVVFSLAKAQGSQFPPETQQLIARVQQGLGAATAAVVWLASRTATPLDDQGAALLAAVMKGFGIDVPPVPALPAPAKVEATSVTVTETTSTPVTPGATAG